MKSGTFTRKSWVWAVQRLFWINFPINAFGRFQEHAPHTKKAERFFYNSCPQVLAKHTWQETKDWKREQIFYLVFFFPHKPKHSLQWVPRSSQKSTILPSFFLAVVSVQPKTPLKHCWDIALAILWFFVFWVETTPQALQSRRKLQICMYLYRNFKTFIFQV